MKIQENRVYSYDAIDFMKMTYEEFGDNSVNLFLVDFPYTFKGKNRVTANKWDLPVDTDEFFKVAKRMLTPNGVIALTATNPFASYLVNKHIDMFKYEWIWEKDNGSNFVHTKYQPMKVHEQILIFGTAPTTYTKKGDNMKYNPQFTYSTPYSIKRDGSDVDNLSGFKGRTDTNNEDGKRYPRSVQKVNLERGLHPTQKPVELFEYLIRTYTDEGDLVIDCCAGSGTTAIASINSNRNYIVNDNNYEYEKLMNKRIKEHMESLSQS